jgi:molybdopterin/thiamine biosynthesis adenylyltransferase
MPPTHSLWNTAYADLTSRNLGLLSEEEQMRLKNAKVSILGMGGFGGVIFEILVRSGIEKFSIADHDVFEATNKNRQIFAFDPTLGHKKTEIAKKQARMINPDVKIDVFGRVDETNVQAILQAADLAVLVLDDFKASLIAARKARQMGITFVEGWALPYANACTFTPQSASFEQTYGLEDIQDLPTRAISEEQAKQLLIRLLFGFGRVEALAEYYSNETLANLARGIQPSFAPMVWATANLIAIEGIKVLLNWGALALSPHFAIYDPFLHKIPQNMADLPDNKKEIAQQLTTHPEP